MRTACGIAWVPLRRFYRSPPMGTVLTVDTLSFNRPGLPTSASCWPPWIQGCALESRPAAPTSPLPWGLHHAGPVGVDHSMELQPGPLDPSRELQPGPLGSMVVHTSGPGIQGCASCWPMDPWLCIESRPGVCRRSTNVCRRLHTFNQCLPTSAYFRPGRR
jgi:hypothetical protein